jgi:ribosome biogenesis GTPase / thiamine phosphate phosphatase
MCRMLADLGWNSDFERSFASYRADRLVAGRVARQDRDRCTVWTETGELTGTPAGRLRHAALERGALPAVGDWVALRPSPDGGLGVIEAVLPRKSCISRKAVRAGGPQYGPGRVEEQVLAANIDTAFLVSGLNEDFNARRVERYLATAWDSGAVPVVILNKADLCADAAARAAEIEASAGGVPIHVVSAAADRGLDALAPYLAPGRTVVFLGSSGVGKSTLINRLLGCARQETLEVREYDGRGRHATTARELIRLPGGAIVIDTPGLREIQLWDDSGGVGLVFDDIADLARDCRFRDCRHASEPGCAVKAAVLAGRLDAGRLENYRKLQREQAVLAVRRSQRARMVFGQGGKRLR